MYPNINKVPHLAATLLFAVFILWSSGVFAGIPSGGSGAMFANGSNGGAGMVSSSAKIAALKQSALRAQLDAAIAKSEYEKKKEQALTLAVVGVHALNLVLPIPGASYAIGATAAQVIAVELGVFLSSVNNIFGAAGAIRDILK